MEPRRNGLGNFILLVITLLAALCWQSDSNAGELLLRWSDNSSNEDGFKIERKPGAAGTYAHIASVGANVTSYSDSGLNAGSMYCYRVLAFNAAGGSPYSDPACGTVSSNFTLSVAKMGTGSGTVTSAPSGINCGNTCSASYNGGTLVTLTAAPAAGSSFSGWSGIGCNNGVVSMNANTACTGTFNTAPQQFTLSVNVVKTVTDGGTGSGIVTSVPSGVNCGNTCSASYNSGTLVTLMAAPAAGSTFSGWSGTGCTNGAVTMNANITCAVTFKPQPAQSFTLFVSKSGTGTGTVTSAPSGIDCGSSCSASYNSGTLVTLTAAPVAGSTFSGWSGTGCTNGAVTINTSIGCTATFQASADQLATKIGIFRPETGEWFLDHNGNGQWDGCNVDICLKSFGSPGDLPIVGKWSRNGLSNLGIFNSATGTWQLDTNGNGVWDGCSVDTCVSSFGRPGDLPVTRELSGATQTIIGTYTPQSTFSLKRRTVTQQGIWKFDVNANEKLDSCGIDECDQNFGTRSDLPIVGDWNGTGTEEIGVFKPSTGQWYADRNGNGKWDGCRKDKCFGPFGLAGDLPVVGDWDGIMNTRIGVFRPRTGQWLLDMNGNGKWDGCRLDACIESFGQQGDWPVTGKW